MFKRGNGNGNGGINIVRDVRTPAEVTRRESAGWIQDFWIPLAMAAVLGASAMILFWAGMWAVRALGRGGFWFVSGAICFGHLVYIIWMAARYDNESIRSTIYTGVLVAALTGLFALAVDQVMFLYALQAVQVAPFIGLLVFVTMLAVRFVQELGLFGSPFIEKAIGDLLGKALGDDWLGGRLRAEPCAVPRPIPARGLPAIQPMDAEIELNHATVATNNGTFKAPSGKVRTRSDLAEFVERVGRGIIEPQLSSWRNRSVGRDDDWWRDMVDVAAMFGLVSSRGGGRKITVLRNDWLNVLREIEAGLSD